MKSVLSKLLSWHWIHSFLGLWCSLIFAFIFLTGTLAIFATEIDWLLTKEMRVSADGREKIAFSQVYGAAQEARPDNTIVRIYRRDDPWMADQVGYLVKGGKTRFLWVDPYSGVALGDTSSHSFHETIGELHTRLFIPTKAGIMIVTVFSLALTASLIAGIFLLPRFWKSFVTLPRFGGSKRAMFSDLHRLLGAWSIPFVLMVSLTTLYYFAETLNLDAPPLAQNVNTEPREARQPADMSEDKVAAMLEIAYGVYPDLKIKALLLPRTRVQPVRIEGDMDAVLVRERANMVYLHPETLEVIASHRGEDLSLHQRVSEAVDPIHWGYWGGMWSKGVWLVFGVMLTALPLLGAAIFAKRMGVRRAKLEGVELSGWRVYWDGMGLGKWGALALIAASLALMMKELLLG